MPRPTPFVEVAQRALALREKGVSVSAIMRATGLKSHRAVWSACFRARHPDRIAANNAKARRKRAEAAKLRPPPAPIYTDEADEYICANYAKKRKLAMADELTNMLGRDVTKNMVIGRAHRLGLCKRTPGRVGPKRKRGRSWRAKKKESAHDVDRAAKAAA